MLPVPLAGGVFMGWALGANDAGNVVGTAVGSRVVTIREATLLCAVWVILGAYLQGSAGMHTYSGLIDQQMSTLIVTVLAAAITVTIMTVQSLPISASQAVVGAIAGVGLATDSMNWRILEKVVICWITAPLGAMLIAIVLYYALGWILVRIPMSVFSRDKLLLSGLLIMGSYGSYALGANNVANVTGVFSGQFLNVGLSDSRLAFIGGVSIAFGVLTYSRRVMTTVGTGIMMLDAFTGLVCVTAMALTVHVFAIIGVPVSTSHAVVGAVTGVGLLRGGDALRLPALKKIAVGWLMTPLISLILSAAAFAIFCH